MPIYQPRSTERLLDWVNQRIIQAAPFRVSGNKTHFQGAQDTDVSLRFMRKVNFFNPEDMVIGVEAGLQIEILQKLLCTEGMYLPINPHHKKSSVAGIIASNDLGPDQMFRGGVRDYIIGLEYINGYGKRVKTGGKVVKNVAGYDLGKMMVGSFGGFGVILSVNFKMVPLPKNPRGIFAEYSNNRWQDDLQNIAVQKIPLDWLYLYRSLKNSWILGIGISGNPDRQKRIQKDIQEQIQPPFQILEETEQNRLPDFPATAQRHIHWLEAWQESWGILSNHFHIQAFAPFSDILKKYDWASLSKSPLRLLLHPIGGNIHFGLPISDLEEQKHAFTAIQRVTQNTDTKFQIHRAHPELRKGIESSYKNTSEYQMVQRLKTKIDPHAIFHSSFYD